MPTPPRQILVAGILVAVGLVLVASEVVQQAWNRQAGLLEPWQRAMAGAGLADDGSEAARTVEALANAQAELAMLRGRLTEYESIRGEGGIDPRDALLGRPHVIARSTRQGRRYVEIDFGSLDGVEPGMAAIVGWSLVGVVDGVNEGRSSIRQVTDAESRVPAVLMADDRVVAEGVLAGNGTRGLLSLDFVEDRQGLLIEPGQRVVTAAQPPTIPRGLVLGVVTAASRSPATDHWRIEVVPLHVAEACETLALLRPAVSPP